MLKDKFKKIGKSGCFDELELLFCTSRLCLDGFIGQDSEACTLFSIGNKLYEEDTNYFICFSIHFR